MTIALTANHDKTPDDLVSVRGEVTAFVYDDEDLDDEQNDDDDADDENETDDEEDYDHTETDDDENETDDDDVGEVDDDMDDARIMSHDHKDKIPSEMKVTSFIIDNKTIVECGPWWYWVYMKINITDFVHIGDVVNVTGELEEEDEDGMDVLVAWHIDNETTDDELTIKEEGRPPWAGGPRALGIDPWPMSYEDC